MKKLSEFLAEASKYKLYHSSYTSALGEARKVAEKQGYTVDEDDWFRKVATGPKKPSLDNTNSMNVKLQNKMGKKGKHMLAIQVYRMSDSKFELNCYVT